MNTLTEYRKPNPRILCPSGHVPLTGWEREGTERVTRRYGKARSGWTRTAVVERCAGEWRWRVEEHHGVRSFVVSRGIRAALFPEMLFAFADLAARTQR